MAMASSVLGTSSLLLPNQFQRCATPAISRSSLWACRDSSRPQIVAALRSGVGALGGNRLGLSALTKGSPLLLQLERVLNGAVSRRENYGRGLNVRAQAGRGGGDRVNAAERVVAALGYFLPLFDGIQYGRYFFLQFPVAERLIAPLFPLLSAYKGFPFSNFIAFFGLYLAVVRNPSFSRYVRFNTMQAVVLDVLLIFPTLVERTFTPRGGIGFELLVIFYNTTFLFLVACFLFGVVSCILGKIPRLPLVAEAADQQV
ncbi:protein TIC 20-v, chloroplastic [Physcomitrium patens]|uniref:Protein TIC 20 n=1 Tax=Physcomitrium patens TaxID=3218 RepID=A0A2K1JLE8_PHYPA|nr:protein TIC 20-v, chloroplastic-like [Physcomitrium patens]PNR42357.1 hypothetical protein PHYPA_017186 [Physcomitrium patens]|eukprot:XP_024391888.1 protein TIC 20-v, chloroplastic-like [Physcomitrella patens]